MIWLKTSNNCSYIWSILNGAFGRIFLKPPIITQRQKKNKKKQRKGHQLDPTRDILITYDASIGAPQRERFELINIVNIVYK